MSNHVSRDTAILLSDAGFKQPEFEAGQHWYDPKDGAKIVILQVSEDYRAYWATINKSYDTGSFRLDHDDARLFVFAPTATDIMKELGRDFSISYMNGEWFVLKSSGDFLPFSKSPSVWKHIISAEAAAMAWLALNKKI